MAAYHIGQAMRDMGKERFTAWTRTRRGPWRGHLTPHACEAAARRGSEEARAQLELFKAELVRQRLKK